MKIPNILTIRQSIILALSAVTLAVFLKIFGSLAISILGAIAMISAIYAAILKWAPEYVAEKKK